MPTFKFKAKKIDGEEEIEGIREAENEYALTQELRKDNYILVDFKKQGIKKKFAFLAGFISHISLSEKMLFFRNLSIMISAGLTITRALEVLERQTRNKSLKEIIKEIRSDVTKGNNTSDSMAVHKKIFPKFAIAMIRAGEKSGKMDESMNLVADQMDKEYQLKKKIRGAMIYPSIVLSTMIVISILMLVYVMPTLVSTFTELGVELPLSTKVMIWTSSAIINNYVLIIILFLAFLFGIIAVSKTEKFKRTAGNIIFHLPLMAPLVQKINSARTARTLSSLVSSGVEIIEALDVTSDVVQNFHYKEVLKKAKEEIKKGSKMSSIFKKYEKIYPPLVGEMIAVGEETGKLSDMLFKLAVFYEGEVSETTKNLTVIIEPILMLVIGAAVGFFALSMITPMYSVMNGI